MRLVSQLTVLNSYLAKSTGHSAGTTLLGMLNLVLPRLYEMGPWKSLLAETEIDCSAGYISLPPDYESIHMALMDDLPVDIFGILHEYQVNGPGIIPPGSSNVYGIVDEGWVPLMSEVPTGGIESLIFTSTAAFASGDSVALTFVDSASDYQEVTLPLYLVGNMTTNTGSPPANAYSASAGLATEIYMASNPITAGFLVGMGVTIAGATSGTGYNASWTITAISAASLTIDKAWDSTNNVTGTITVSANGIYTPTNSITSMEPITYTSLPARVTMKDADDVLYAIFPAGDGVAQFRRYQVPQPPESTTDTWTLQALCKRAFIPLLSNTDKVYLDNINVLRTAFRGVTMEDAGDFERSGYYWKQAKSMLNEELANTNGGIKHIPTFQMWGDGIAPLPCRY